METLVFCLLRFFVVDFSFIYFLVRDVIRCGSILMAKLIDLRVRGGRNWGPSAQKNQNVITVLMMIMSMVSCQCVVMNICIAVVSA